MDNNLHVRRCHVCGTVTESSDEILKCKGCSKSLLPFYYFDKRKIREYSDKQESAKLEKLPDLNGYGPIRGLTAYW